MSTSGLLLSADMAILPLKSELMVLRLLYSMSLRLQYGTMNIINQKKYERKCRIFLYYESVLQNSAGWRLGKKLGDFEQKHGNPTMDLLQ